MSKLGRWLRMELQERGLTQSQAAVHAGVGQATISGILNKEHIPKVETLFRLADLLGTPREEVLRLAGHLPPAPRGEAAAVEAGGSSEEQIMIQALVREFRHVPDEWKEAVIQQVRQYRRLAELRPVRIIGADDEEELEREEAASEPAETPD
ncbi:MAG: helix-turn-helix transcriptional regulator [Anaerolineae bacterium]